MTDPIKPVLRRLADGEVTVEQAGRELHALAQQSLGFATLDHHRHTRCGVPEVVYAAGKTPEQVVAISRALLERTGHALITRADETHAAAVKDAFANVHAGSRGRTLLVGEVAPPAEPAIPIITAGTSDEAVAEEAAITCRALGQQTQRINDVGVAGIARLVSRLDDLGPTGVIICIAGMEGALPSVVGGLVNVPVIAVPTSVGYGAALGGMTAMLSMLTSCAAGVSVVNIDNGFGAAYTATLIQRQTFPEAPEATPHASPQAPPADTH